MSTSIKAMMPFAYFKSAIVPHAEAMISIASHSLQYGTMCSAACVVYVVGKEARILRLRDHHERLMNAAKILGFNIICPMRNFTPLFLKLLKLTPPNRFLFKTIYFFRRRSNWPLHG